MNRLLLHCAGLLLGGALLAGCQQPTVASAADTEGLSAIERSRLDLAKADPAVDFGAYNGIVIEELGFSRLNIVEPRGQSPRYGKFTLDEGDMAALRKLYREQLGRTLGESRYRIADTPGAGTLRLVSDLVRLAPNAPRDRDLRLGGSVRNEVYTEGAGSMTLEAQLIDPASGRTVALLRHKLTDPEVWGSNNPVSNRFAVTRAFARWGALLRQQLEVFGRGG